MSVNGKKDENENPSDNNIGFDSPRNPSKGGEN